MLKPTYLLSSIALAALPATAFAQEAPQPDDAAGSAASGRLSIRTGKVEDMPC